MVISMVISMVIFQEGDGGKMTIEHMSWGMKADP